MRSEAPADFLKVWLYAAASLVLGAWVSPLIYNAGKALAEVSSAKQTNGPLEWLAGLCRTTAFPGYFKAALLLSAAVLFVPFLQSLAAGRAAERANGWFPRLPEGARVPIGGQRLRNNAGGPLQWVTGFLLVAGLFFGIAATLIPAGVFDWRNPGESLPRIAATAFATALGLAVAQEILFRGIALGIFLRAMRPTAALIMAAVFFALVHFTIPPPGLTVADPDAAGTGFELLWKSGARFFEPRAVLGSFTPLLALGAVLAYARWRTASLWLPAGLHAGWIFVNAVLGRVTVATGQPDSLLVSGTSFHQGLVPLAGILLAGVLANFLTRPDDAADTHA